MERNFERRQREAFEALFRKTHEERRILFHRVKQVIEATRIREKELQKQRRVHAQDRRSSMRGNAPHSRYVKVWSDGALFGSSSSIVPTAQSSNAHQVKMEAASLESVPSPEHLDLRTKDIPPSNSNQIAHISQIAENTVSSQSPDILASVDTITNAESDELDTDHDKNHRTMDRGDVAALKRRTSEDDDNETKVLSSTFRNMAVFGLDINDDFEDDVDFDESFDGDYTHEDFDAEIVENYADSENSEKERSSIQTRNVAHNIARRLLADESSSDHVVGSLPVRIPARQIQTYTSTEATLRNAHQPQVNIGINPTGSQGNEEEEDDVDDFSPTHLVPDDALIDDQPFSYIASYMAIRHQLFAQRPDRDDIHKNANLDDIDFGDD